MLTTRSWPLLTRISLKSSFLSDPEFPKSAFVYYRGMRIRFFENIYQQYTTLDFSRHTDRSVAMGGLEKRLVRTYNTMGAYGILHDFLGRSLLWQRDDHIPSLQQIDYRDQRVPSWSWMAVKGAIKYMDIPFDTVDWSEEKELKSPFTTAPNGSEGCDSAQQVGDLQARVRDFALEKRANVIFDRPEEGQTIPNLKCVVVGTEKDLPESNKYYVLIAAPARSGEGNTDYKRVGVAVMAKKDIKLGNSGDWVRII
jgi:hypothetical protein